MDSISSVHFVTLDGEIPDYGIDLENITRPFVDGNAFRRMGKHAEAGNLRGVAFASSLSAAKALCETTYRLLKGSGLYTVTQGGVATTNCLVLGVRAQYQQLLTICAPSFTDVTYGAAGFVIFSEWQIIRGNAP